MTDAIRTAIEGASAYLTEHSDEARYTDSLATARIDSGLRVRVPTTVGLGEDCVVMELSRR